MRFGCQILSLFFFLIVSANLFAQTINNLVPNPDFESYNSCPYEPDQVGNLDYWQAHYASPDYLNSCADPLSIPSVSVPSNWWGFQYAASGNGYVGLACYDDVGLPWPSREMIGADLLDTLIIGERYYVKFNLNSANLPQLLLSHDNVGVDRFGVYFSEGPLPDFSYLPNYSHFYVDSVFLDTTNWVAVMGSFIADQEYTRVSLGIFYEDDSLEVVETDTVNGSAAYFFLDDVYVGNDDIPIPIPLSDIKFEAQINISIYPNPFTDYLILDCPTNNLTFVNIISMEGKSKINSYEISGKTILNTSNLPSGIYLIELTNSSFTQKYRLVKF